MTEDSNDASKSLLEHNNAHIDVNVDINTDIHVNIDTNIDVKTDIYKNCETSTFLQPIDNFRLDARIFSINQTR